MNPSTSIMIFITIACIIGSIGALLLKLGASKFKKFHRLWLLQIIKNYQLILGVLMYGLSTVFFLMALRLGELSVVYPLSSLSYIFIAILSMYFLKEKMNWYKWAGIAFIILGVILVKL